MKIKAALIIGLIVLNGSAYAMAVNGMSMPVPLFQLRQTQVELPKIPAAPAKINQEAAQEKHVKMRSRLDGLIAEYEVSRRLNSSS